jgi:hypothetical protein
MLQQPILGQEVTLDALTETMQYTTDVSIQWRWRLETCTQAYDDNRRIANSVRRGEAVE